MGRTVFSEKTFLKKDNLDGLAQRTLLTSKKCRQLFRSEPSAAVLAAQIYTLIELKGVHALCRLSGPRVLRDGERD
jgi:hypothetical protein